MKCKIPAILFDLAIFWESEKNCPKKKKNRYNIWFKTRFSSHKMTKNVTFLKWIPRAIFDLRLILKTHKSTPPQMDPSTNCHSRPIKMTHILLIRHKSESDPILQESDLILQESESDPIMGDFGKSRKSLNPLNEM